MSKTRKVKTVTLFPNGTRRKKIDPRDIVIPDLWWVTDDRVRIDEDKKINKRAKDQILETWYLANELKRLLLETLGCIEAWAEDQ